MDTKLRVGIISPKYSSKDKHSFAFVHARAKLYIKNDIEVKSFVISDEDARYNFECVPVIKQPVRLLLNSIRKFNPDVLAIHYPIAHIISLAKNIKLPKVVWIHGHEILRNFRLRSTTNRFDYIQKRLLLIPRECYKIYNIRNFLDKVDFIIFVSEWMKKTAEKHSLKKYKNSIVIPNPVDTKLFNYEVPQKISRAISLRSFDNTKYGLEIAIKAYSNIKKSELFLYGTGRFKKKYIRLAKRTNSNTTIIDKTIVHNQVPKLYHNYGFFVAPSRIEAQGLAMCEAMACGLPVIATKVGGIPKFVRDGIDGYLVPPDDPESMREAVIKLISDPKKYLEMSRNARENILNTCSEKVVIKKEIEVLKKAIENYREN